MTEQEFKDILLIVNECTNYASGEIQYTELVDKLKAYYDAHSNSRQ